MIRKSKLLRGGRSNVLFRWVKFIKKNHIQIHSRSLTQAVGKVRGRI